MNDIIYRHESYKIIGLCLDVHNSLGPGFLEIVYKDALEFEMQKAKLLYEREKQYEVNYKGVILPHKFYADFVVMDKIVLEVKACQSISHTHISQTINYLKVSDNRLGIVVNFGDVKLEYRRTVL